MAVPKKKVSPGRKKTRRQFYALTATGYSACPNCLELRRPHRICSSCGHYDSKQVMQPKASKAEATA